MGFTYDPSLPAGQVRLLAGDADKDNFRFDDSEVTAFLTLNNQDVRMAAAQALDVLAGEWANEVGRVEIEGVLLEGRFAAQALREQATELRRQVKDADADGTGLFDWAEMVQDQFTLRQRLLSELLRQTS